MRTFRLMTFVVALLTAGTVAAQSGNPLDGLTGALSTEDTRLTTGVDSTASSASTAQQHLLIDFMLTAPLGSEVTRASKPFATAWLNARFSGAPTNAVSGVKQFVGGFEKELVSGDTSNLLSSLAFRAGLEFRIGKAARSFSFGSDFQFQPTIIAAFGVQTVPALKTPAVFDLPEHTDDPADKFSNLPYERWNIPVNGGYKYLALGDPDRRRFYKSFEVGLRLKTHHFNDCEPPAEAGCSTDRRRNFPGMIDLTLGQDASITGGERRGMVGRVDAFYPLPADNIANAVYMFGAIRVHWVVGVNAEEDPVILRAPSAAIVLPSKEVFEHTLTPDERTRDEWKFGIGVDLVRLFTAATAKRGEDAASEARENGSSAELAKNDDVLVVRRAIQIGETTTFNHGVDIAIPQQSATLQAESIPAGGSGPINFVKDEVRIELATKRTLKNTSNALFEETLVRLKPGEPKGTFPDVKAGIETVLSKPDESRYRVSKVVCPATCTFSYTADVNNTVAIVPLTATTISIDGGAGQAKNPYQAVVVERNKAVAVTGAATFVVVRIR